MYSCQAHDDKLPISGGCPINLSFKISSAGTLAVGIPSRAVPTRNAKRKVASWHIRTGKTARRAVGVGIDSSVAVGRDHVVSNRKVVVPVCRDPTLSGRMAKMYDGNASFSWPVV